MNIVLNIVYKHTSMILYKFVCVKISVRIKGEIIRTVSSRVVPRFSQTSFPVFTCPTEKKTTKEGP